MSFTELLGVYDADGGLRGEAAYVVGKLLGRRHCGLCDITHSPVRRKREWDAMVADLAVPFRLRHLNELAADEEAAVRRHGAPVVLGRRVDHAGGPWDLVLDRAALDGAGGDVTRFRVALDAALAGRA